MMYCCADWKGAAYERVSLHTGNFLQMEHIGRCVNQYVTEGRIQEMKSIYLMWKQARAQWQALDGRLAERH